MFLSASGKVAKQQRALQDAQATYNAMPAPPLRSSAPTELPAAAHDARDRARVCARTARRLGPAAARGVAGRAQRRLAAQPERAVAGTRCRGRRRATPGTVTQTFTVTGCTYSQDSVARFLARLDVVPDLSDMTLGKSQSGGDARHGADRRSAPRAWSPSRCRAPARGGSDVVKKKLKALDMRHSDRRRRPRRAPRRVPAHISSSRRRERRRPRSDADRRHADADLPAQGRPEGGRTSADDRGRPTCSGSRARCPTARTCPGSS